MINVYNLTKSQINRPFLKKIARKILREEGLKKSARLSIVLVGLSRIKELNKTYRKDDRITDVLSFGKEVEDKYSKFFIFPKNYSNLGEIVICLKQVKKDAHGFKTSFKKELVKVLIHGILHLLGYSHEISKKEAQKMREKEKYYLRCFVQKNELKE